MKKLIMLMFLLSMSLSSFSQTVTKPKSIMVRDSVVKLEVPIVRLVIKDLVTFDGLKLELVETKELLKLSHDKLVLKDSVITNLNDKTINLRSMINKKDEQFGLEKEKSQSLEKELKQQKRRTFWWKVGTVAGGVLALFFAAGG